VFQKKKCTRQAFLAGCSTTVYISHPSLDFTCYSALETTFVKQVSGYLIVEREKADAANLASFQKGEELMEAGEFSDAEKIFSALNTIGYPNAQEKYDEAETKYEEYKEAEKVRREAAEKAEQERAENYQKAVALEEAEDYEQAISIYEGLGDYKDCAERIMACNEKNEKKKRMLNLQKTQQLMEIDSEIEQNKEIMDDFIDTILEIHESIMGNKECSFSLQTVDKARKKTPVELTLRIYDDGSHSVDRTKVFIYDMALLFNQYTRDRHPLFLVPPV